MAFGSFSWCWVLVCAFGCGWWVANCARVLLCFVEFVFIWSGFVSGCVGSLVWVCF